MRVLAVLAATAALVLGASVPYVRSRTDRTAPDAGHCLGWPAGSVEFRENAAGAPETGDAGFLAMERSLATWATPMSACGNLLLRMGPRTSSRTVGFNDARGASNENVLLFRTRLCSAVVPENDPCLAEGSCANDHDCWDFDRGTLAITTTTYNVTTGRLYDSDLEMNAAAHTFTTLDAPPCTALDQTGQRDEELTMTVVGKDISPRGISFFHERPLPYRRAIVTFEHPDIGHFEMEADIGWCQFTGVGWYVSGGRLVRAAVQKPFESLAE